MSRKRKGWRVYKKDPRRTRYTIKGRDHLNIVRQMPAYRSKDLSQELARKVAELVDYRRQRAALPPDLASWLQGLAIEYQKKLCEWGLMPEYARPLEEHIEDYKSELTSRGNTPEYVTKTIFRIRRIADGCRFTFWSDVRGSAVQQFIASMSRNPNPRKASKAKAHSKSKSAEAPTSDQDATKPKPRKATARTKNFYLRDFKSFARWAVRDGRLPKSPVEHLKPLDANKVRNDQRHERRALTVAEVERLLNTTTLGVERFGMSGRERGMLYRLAVETGLRASELRSLTRESFHLEGEEPIVTAIRDVTKNRQTACLPLRPTTAAELMTILSNKLPATRAFNMPKADVVIDMLRVDLDDAGIVYKLDEQRGLVADFHSLRHTCGTFLAAAGVHPKLIQTIMRHSTITLTMDKYTHAFKSDEVEAVAKLPDFSPAMQAEQQATGTTDVSPADEPNENPTSRGAKRGALGGRQWTQSPGPVDNNTDDEADGALDDAEETPVNSKKTPRSSDEDRGVGQCRRVDSNHRPRAYESPIICGKHGKNGRF